MTANRVSIAEITAKAINILCRELGAVNTVRFLNQFSTGFGDYTKDRDQILGDATVEQLVAEIKQRRYIDTKSEDQAKTLSPDQALKPS